MYVMVDFFLCSLKLILLAFTEMIFFHFGGPNAVVLLFYVGVGGSACLSLDFSKGPSLRYFFLKMFLSYAF